MSFVAASFRFMEPKFMNDTTKGYFEESHTSIMSDGVLEEVEASDTYHNFERRTEPVLAEGELLILIYLL
jgi:hypothetical protein